MWNQNLKVFTFSLKLNARKASQKSALSAEARQKLKSWLSADYHLYNHFVNKLEDKLVKFGKERMAAEVADLQRLNLEVRKRCVLEEVKDTGKLSEDFRPWSKDVVGFQVSPEEGCQHFAKTDVFSPNVDLTVIPHFTFSGSFYRGGEVQPTETTTRMVEKQGRMTERNRKLKGVENYKFSRGNKSDKWSSTQKCLKYK